MCTVQVLLFADVTRRTDVPYSTGELDNALVPRSICRKLFVDDHSQSRPNSRLLKTLEANLEKEVKERWNFDFRTGMPLPGRYQWVTVHPAGAVADRVDSVVSEVLPQMGTDITGKKEKRPGSSTTTAPRETSRSKSTSQSKITDFLHQRKRNRTVEVSDLSSPKLKSRRLVDTSVTSE